MQSYLRGISIAISTKAVSSFCRDGQIISTSFLLCLSLLAVASGVSLLAFSGSSISVGALTGGVAVPEAGAIAILGLGLAALACARRKCAA